MRTCLRLFAIILLTAMSSTAFANEPWTLFPQDNAQRIEAGGWINGGVMVNANGNRTRNDPTPFSNPAGEFLGNQVWGYVGRAADNGGCGWDWGARADFVFGADGPDTQAFGGTRKDWDFGWNTGGEYGSAIPQLYGEIAYNDWLVKFGHFYTIMGYEVVQAPGNFFYSHAYTMNFGEPFTHTGMLAEYAYDTETTLWAGYTMGWDTGFNGSTDAHTFLGGVRRQLGDNVSVTYTVNAGRYGNGLGGSGNLGRIFMHSFVLDVQLTDRLNYVLLHDLAINSIPGVGPFGNLGNAEWYGITQYLFYEINCKLKAGVRFEWFDDADGLRIATVNNGLNDLHYFGATIGLNYKPCPNVVIRPEMRFDWTTSHSDMDFNDVFVNNTRSNIELFGVDFILTF